MNISLRTLIALSIICVGAMPTGGLLANNDPAPANKFSTATAAATDSDTVEALRRAANQSRIDLGKIAGLENSYLKSLSVHSPTVTPDGNVLGSVMFGGRRAGALLQYVDDDFGQWVLVLKSPQGKLGDMIPGISGMLVDQIRIDSGLVFISAHEAKIEGTELSQAERNFYRDVFSDPEFEVDLPLGMSLAFAADSRIMPAPVDLMLTVTGNAQTKMIVQGTLGLSLEIESIVNKLGERKLDSDVLVNFELSATLPDIEIPGLPPTFKTTRGKLTFSTDPELSETASGRKSSPRGKNQKNRSIKFASPSLALTFGMSFIDGAGLTRDFNAKIEVTLGDADKKSHSVIGRKEVSIFAETVTEEPWTNAFGINGFNLSTVRLLLTADSYQRVGIGLGAEMEIAGHQIDVAGKLSFHAVTGMPTGDFFSGKMDRITSNDLVALANANRPGANRISRPGIPAFELRNVELTVAPFTGSDELEVERGIAIKGQLFSMGQQLAHADVLVDLFTLTPRIRVDAAARNANLGIVELRDANIDILLAAGGNKNHFKIKGYTRVLDASRLVDVQLTDQRMYFRINDRLAGVYETDFEIGANFSSRPEWFVTGTFRNEFSSGMGKTVSRDVLAWANQVQNDVRAAQRDLDIAMRDVRKLDSQIENARRLVQQDRNRHMQNINAAKREVQKINNDITNRRNAVKSARRSEVNSLKSKVSAKKKALDRAVAATRKAPIWEKPAKMADEAAKRVDYEATRGHYNALIGVHKRTSIDADPVIVGLIASRDTAKFALRQVKNASGEIFKVSVDADPRVAGLIGARATALAGLQIARDAVGGFGNAANTSAQITSYAARGEIFEVKSAKLHARLDAFQSGGMTIELQVRVLGKAQTLKIATKSGELKSGTLFQRVGNELFARK